MKVVELEQAALERCVDEAQKERIVILRKGKPVAMVIGIEGMDEEQYNAV